MRNYCTLFDTNYLTRGLALYRSLLATGDSFTLYVVCFDRFTLETLECLDLPGLVPIPLEQVETAALKEAKKGRSVAEYCWTCTAHVIRHVLDAYRTGEVTYLDADLYFYQRPSKILEEMDLAGASVLLTEHRFSPALHRDIRFGRYCVQFMTFKDDARGRTALNWWCDRTLEWCYARLEDGKFGDQKYLDDWCQRFPGIHVCPHPGAGVANWNLQQYRLSGSAEAPRVDGSEVVFFHFHSLKVYRDGRCDLGYKPLPPEAPGLFYRPYLAALAEVERELAARLPTFSAGRLDNRHPLAQAISYLLRKPKGTYNVHRLL
jgi:hypothetical protein